MFTIEETQEANIPDRQINGAVLYDDEQYTAYTEDLEFMWRWSIYSENRLLQEGCSLTEDASRRAVNHVLAYFKIAQQNNVEGQGG